MGSTSAMDERFLDQEPIEIDGSVLEGGGQILRIATACSALLQKPIRVIKIRAGRDKPGLRPQQMIGLQLVRDLCHAMLTGAFVGSTEIKFVPNKLISGEFLADTKTAGSVGLLIQVALPILIYAPGPCKVTLKGGTDTENAPPMDLILDVLKPALTHFGIDFKCTVVRRGTNSKGGGEVVVGTEPVKDLKPIEFIERENLVKIGGRSWVAGKVPKQVAERTALSVRNILRKSLQEPNIPIHVSEVFETKQTAFGDGAGILLWVETSNGYRLAGSALWRKSVQAEKVGEEAAEMLLNNLKHEECVDEYLQDQLLIFMALAKGTSKLRTGPLTLHTKTAIHILGLLTDAKFTVIELENDGNLIECKGIGYNQ